MKRVSCFSLSLAIALSVSAAGATATAAATLASAASATALAQIPIATPISENEKLGAVLKFVFENEAEKYGWPANYRSMWCPTNVFNLLSRLDQAKVDLARAQVWYILPRAAVQGAGETTIHPRAARAVGGARVNEWSFHTVLQIDGRILDLDFTDRPAVVSLAGYAAAMWQKGPLAQVPDRRPLFIRAISARDYLNSYSGNWSWYLSGAGGRVTAVDFDSLL